MRAMHLPASATSRTSVSCVLIWCVGLGIGIWQVRLFAGEPACPDSNALYQQCPNFARNGGEEEYYTLSDVEEDVSVADNFTLQADGTIDRIRWWGTYLNGDSGCGPPDPDDFTVLVWGGSDGSPAGPEPLPIPVHTVTRLGQPVGTVPAALGPAVVFEYELAFDDQGLGVGAGETYWLEIRNQPPFCNWVWLTAPNPPGDGTSSQRSPTTDPDWSTPTTRGFDLAFALLSEPPTIPAASNWGIVALAIILPTVGIVVLRRDRESRAAQRRRPRFPPVRSEA